MAGLDVGVGIGVLGILVTFATFYPLYQRTNGASRVSERTARKEAISILTRSFTRDKIAPSIDLILSVTKAKWEEHDISGIDVPPADSLLAEITSKVLENEYIDASEKDQVLSKLRPLLSQTSQPIRLPQSPRGSRARKSGLILDFVTSLIVDVAATVAIATFEHLSWNFLLSVYIPILTGLSIVMAALAYFLYERDVPKVPETVSSQTLGLSEVINSALVEVFPGFEVVHSENALGSMHEVFSTTSGKRYLILDRALSRKLGARSVRAFAKQAGAGKTLVIVTNSKPTKVAASLSQKNNIVILGEVKTREEAVAKLRGLA